MTCALALVACGDNNHRAFEDAAIVDDDGGGGSGSDAGSGSDDGGVNDAGIDAMADAGIDAMTDAGPDAMPDAMTDAAMPDGPPCGGANLLTDDNNCGICGHVCGSGTHCSDGVCCASGTVSCDGQTCTNPLDDEANCGGCAGSGGTACSNGETCLTGLCCGPGESVCGSTCVDKLNDPNNCGGCGTMCSGATPVCSGGVCVGTCAPNEISCNGACVDPDSDHDHCGNCGTACAPNKVCDNGTCANTCSGAGEQTCGGDCVNVNTDANHCGNCNTACGPNDECVNGVCQLDCPAGETLCNGVCRNLTQDPDNCGMCGIDCGTGTCQTGLCCPAGTTRCGNQCVNLGTDPNHCGTCATTCGAGPDTSCKSGVCCSPTENNCGGSCSDPLNDDNNCGACGNACTGGAVCDNGQCCGAGTYNSDGKCCAVGTVNCNGTCVNLNNPATCGTTCANKTACAGNQLCSSGACVLNCTGGTTNCSGTCTDTKTDELNCGICDNICPAGSTCTNGSCGACPVGPAQGCNGACTDTSSDPDNCGACGALCTIGQTCSSGMCCPAGKVNCGGTCVDVSSDEANCGACASAGGEVCGSGQSCSNGDCTCGFGQITCGNKCITPSVDPLNCGACGNICGVGANAGKPYCISNGCTAACPAPLAACPIGSSGNSECVNKNDDNDNCGACGTKCAAGKGCVFGQCVTQLSTAPAPSKCDGGGPPIILPTGGSSGGSVCSGNLGATSFTFGLCSRTNLGPLSQDLFTDAFDSTKGPYRPVGTSSTNNACTQDSDCGGTLKCVGAGTSTDPRVCAGGGVGINGTVDPVASNTANTHVGGDFWVFGTIGLAIKNDTTVKQRMLNKGGFQFTKTNKIYGNALINGPWSSQGSNSLAILGSLTTANCSTVPGTVTRASCTSAAWNNTLPDPCGKADGSDGSLIPVKQIVENFRNPANNDNAALGLSYDALANPASDVRLELPCGNYYFSSIGGSNKLAIVVKGHTAIYIGGAVNIAVDMIFDVEPTASLDMFIGGVLRISHPITLGSPAYPRLTRMYIGSASVSGSGSCTSNGQCGNGKCSACPDAPYAPCSGTGICTGGSTLSKAIDMAQGGYFNGLLWAGYGEFSTSNPVEMYGSIYANYADASGALKIHYDNGAVTTGSECPPVFGNSCESCRDCNNQACINNQCGGACTADSQCCPPLHCNTGTGSCEL